MFKAAAMKPQIHFFNPGYESEIALYSTNGFKNYTPSLKVRQMRKDLALLPIWFADPQDYIWIGALKTDHYEENLTDITSFLPKELSTLATPISIATLLNKSFHLPETEIAPWGLSPQNIHFFKEIKKITGQPIIIPPWNEKFTSLTGRQTAAYCLSLLLKRFPGIPSHTPVFCSSIQEIEEYINRHSHPYIIKTPYSSSGRGVYEVIGRHLQENEKQWILGALRKQRIVSIEPLLDKKIDFAMEYAIGKSGKIRFEGFSLFDTTSSGAYIGNRLTSQENIEEYICRSIDRSLLHKVREATGEILQEIYSKDYSGNIGVDMMIYTDKKGCSTIQPCVEINMRNTMGMLSLHLFKHFVFPSATGYFKVVYEKDAYTRHCHMQKLYPQQWREKKLFKGYLPLCPVKQETNYRAYILIE